MKWCEVSPLPPWKSYISHFYQQAEFCLQIVLIGRHFFYLVILVIWQTSPLWRCMCVIYFGTGSLLLNASEKRSCWYMRSSMLIFFFLCLLLYRGHVAIVKSFIYKKHFYVLYLCITLMFFVSYIYLQIVLYIYVY